MTTKQLRHHDPTIIMPRLFMARQLPPLTWLRAFEASARHLSFTNAAAELNLTQAAISKQVRLLEHFLAEPLFQRKPRSLVITKVGAAYLPKVRDAFERLADGTEEVFGGRRAGVLTIRAAAGFAVNWLAPRLGRFFDAYPDIPLRIASSVWNDDFDKERFDLDIQYGSGNWPEYRADQLTFETISPVCAPALATALHTPSDLDQHRLLHVLGYEEGWAVWLKAAGLGPIGAGRGMQCDTSLMAFALAKQGLGVALARSSLVQGELDCNQLVRPFDLYVPIREAFHLITPNSGAVHPHASIFRNWILTQIDVPERSNHG